MITRRNFLKRVGVALAAFGVGVRLNPLEEERVASWPVDNPSFVLSDVGFPKPELTHGGVVPAGAVEILTSDGDVTIANGSVRVLDNFGILNEATMAGIENGQSVCCVKRFYTL